MRWKSALAVLAVAFLGAGDAPALEGDGYARPGWFLDLGGSYAFHWFPSDFDGAVGARTASRAGWPRSSSTSGSTGSTTR
jgi:hypothetical protein